MKNKIVKDTLALTVITLVSGLLLGLVNDITAGPIASQQAKEKEEAYKAVFADAASFETVTSVRIRIWKAIWTKTVLKLRILMKSCLQRMTREMNLAMLLP